MESTTGLLWKSSLAAFKSLSLSLIVGSFIVMFPREDLFQLSLFEDSWASWSWMFRSLPRFGKFSAVFSLSKFYATFSFFSLMAPIIYRFLKMIFYQSHSVSSLFPLLFIILWLDSFKGPVFQLKDSFLCLIYSDVDSLYYIFYFIQCTIWLQNFCLVLFSPYF